MGPFWDDTLESEDAAALDPGPDRFDSTPDVLIVGGGAVGLATAVMCRRAGIDRVCVIDRDRLASGASGSAAGGLSPGVHQLGRPAAFGALATRGLELLRAADAEWNGRLGLRSLDWIITSDQTVAPGPVPSPGLDIVDGDGAREIEPSLGEIAGGIVVRDQAWVNPLRLVIGLAERAGSVATRVAMTELDVRGDRVVRVQTTAGPIAPGSVVIATGNAPAILPQIPSVPVKGHLLVTEPASVRLRAALAGTVLALQLPDGRLLAGGTFEPDDTEPVVRDAAVKRILAELRRLVPAARTLEAERAWCCFRPGTPDDVPIIDRLPDVANVLINVGHFRTGLLVSLAAGEIVAAEVAGEAAGAAGFGLGRFPTALEM